VLIVDAGLMISARADPTPWLTMQSGANQSQAAKFPDNREKYRENRKFGLQNDDGITSKTQHPCGF
jgi:hypothetical protein